MLAYRIKGKVVRVERCAANLYVVRDIPYGFDNRIAIGACIHKDLVQKFLDSFARKVTNEVIDILDVDFEQPLTMCEENCRGCVYWGKGCGADAER